MRCAAMTIAAVMLLVGCGPKAGFREVGVFGQ